MPKNKLDSEYVRVLRYQWSGVEEERRAWEEEQRRLTLELQRSQEKLIKWLESELDNYKDKEDKKPSGSNSELKDREDQIQGAEQPEPLPGPATRSPPEKSPSEKDGVVETKLEAKLNIIDRQAFHRGNPSAFAIDVLDVQTQSPLPIGRRGPVPERIRINSRHILKVLGETADDGIFDPDQCPLVMHRPYKALCFYAETIGSKLSLNDSGRKLAPELPGTGDEDDFNEGENGENEKNANELEEAGGELEVYKKDGGEDGDETTAYQHLQCLVDFLDNHICARMEYLSSDHCRKIYYPDVWYLFHPGVEVIDQGRQQGYRILTVSDAHHQLPSPDGPDWGSRTSIVLKCVYLDFDGKALGPVLREVNITEFEGEKAVTSLEVYPLRFADRNQSADEPSSFGAPERPNELGLREKLITRGRKFLDLTAEFKYMHYDGIALDTLDKVDSPVVVDFKEASLCDAKRRTESSNLDKNQVDDSSDLLEQPWRPQLDTTLIGLSSDPRLIREHNEALSDSDLMIMSCYVYGFILNSRTWAPLSLDRLTPIESVVDIGTTQDTGDKTVSGQFHPDKQLGDKIAFEQLVLPPGHKDLVKSLISQHLHGKSHCATGLVIHLHGVSGVGKTATAEGIARLFGKQLFKIPCGDLGACAHEVKKALVKNFSLASRWGCFLLLDDADDFMTAQTTSVPEMARHSQPSLVSALSRVLKQYSGIVFLTTKSSRDFDEAVTSHVHLSLHYPPLSLISTLEIFELNFGNIKEHFSRQCKKLRIRRNRILASVESYFHSHESCRLSGRQIRDVCWTAAALAEMHSRGPKPELKIRDLELVMDAHLQSTRRNDPTGGVDGEKNGTQRTSVRENLVVVNEKAAEQAEDEEDAVSTTTECQQRQRQRAQDDPTSPSTSPTAMSTGNDNEQTTQETQDAQDAQDEEDAVSTTTERQEQLMYSDTASQSTQQPVRVPDEWECYAG